MRNAVPYDSPNWRSLIAGLKALGWTQQAIADALNCSQGTISQLHTGRHAEPTYSLGVRLLHLYAGATAGHPAPSVQSVRQMDLGAADPAPLHVPGDTNTPAAPGALQIGPVDVS